jgi:arylsulfatase A-like enzyme
VGGAIPVDALSADHVTLAEQLRDAGYATAGLSANGWVSPERGYAQGFERFERREDLLTPALNRRAREILRELAAQERPFFFYVQFMDPHLPNAPPAALIDRFHPRGRDRPGRDGEVLGGLDSLVDTIARYDAEIWRLDRGIAQLFATLRELGLYDDAVIAFVSDHGEQFYEHGEYGHGLKLHDEEIRIPLILKAPGLRGAVDDLVSSIDLAPALLELAGVAALPAAQGLSLLTQRPERAERGAFSEGTMERNHKALIDGQGRKLVLAFGGRSADAVARSETGEVIGLFDLSRGAAAEKEPLVDARATAELRLQLREQYAHSLALREGIRPRTAELAPATVRALEALGYGAAGAQPAAGDD